ncbi:MAG: hypothetical protein WB778_04085 [Thermoplasmata archaeon]
MRGDAVTHHCAARQKMKVVRFGATGMAGRGVVQERLLDPEVQGAPSIGRSAS